MNKPKMTKIENLTPQLIKWTVLMISISVVVVSMLKGLKPDPQFLIEYVGKNLENAAATLVRQYRLNSYLFWCPLLALIIVERLMPANKNQKIFSVGFVQDMLWFVTVPLFGTFLVWRFSGFFNNVYESYLDFFSVPVLAGMPLVLKVILVILASDFLDWFAHLLKHKVKLFWYFHSIHHSQTEMNFMTDKRAHPVERIISFVIRFFPMTLLELQHGVPLGIAWWFFTTWHTMVYHANIRTNYGILKYVLVTPQSHRIHHSRLPEHQDLNFGVIFCFWDRLFRTQHQGCDEYPDTGVADPDFPLEQKRDLGSLFVTLVHQFIYPFKLIIRRGV